MLPPGAPTPEHVAHLTSLRVVAAETESRDLERSIEPALDVHQLAVQAGLDDDQKRATSAVASSNSLVVIEGAAGSSKTTMLKTAIAATASKGRSIRVVTPTKKAADVAAQELGIPTDSVAALVRAHGFRWNNDGVWTRLRPGDTDPETGNTYRGPVTEARLAKGERIVVDEAGMLDQDSALALLRIAEEAGASIALVGDRAQLPAVGRGGVLDFATRLTPAVVDMTSLHRFTDDVYAILTLELRHGRNPAAIFDQLNALGLIKLHEGDDDMQEAIAKTVCLEDAITVATNDEARMLNERIRAERVDRGEVDDVRTVCGNDGLPIGAGDVIQQFVEALTRDRADRGLEDATERSRQAVADLVADGPMSIVSAERDRIVERIAKADAERERWVSAAARLHDQSERHEAEYEPQRELAAAANAKVAALLANVVESLAQRKQRRTVPSSWPRSRPHTQHTARKRTHPVSESARQPAPRKT